VTVLVLKIKWGGLGDHLLYSPIPRIAKELHGYDRVLISNHSDYLNPNTKRLVWEYNPYVDGFSDEDRPYPIFDTVEKGKNLLDAVVDFVGLPDDGERFREPEIYYKPKLLLELTDAIVFESNHGNNIGVPSRRQTEKWFRNHPVKRTHQMKPFKRQSPIPHLPIITAGPLEDFCDVIHSCKAFFCFTSGCATLSAALGKPTTVLYVPGGLPMFHHSKLHTYTRIG